MVGLATHRPLLEGLRIDKISSGACSAALCTDSGLLKFSFQTMRKQGDIRNK